MDITLPLSEAFALAAAKEPFPAVVRSVTADGTAVHLEIDLRVIPDPPLALRVAAAAIGTVSVSATFTGYSLGTATFEIAAHARSLPAHKLLNHLTGQIDSALRRRGLPEGLVVVHKGEDEPVVAIHLQDAVAAKSTGISLTAFDIREATAYVHLAVGEVALL